MFVCEGWREETWSLPFLISLKWAGNTLQGSWVCSVFSPKKTVIKILAFLFPVCEFVCTQLLAAACSTAPPCLLALLLALGWPLISLSSSSSDCSSSGVYTFHVGIFLQSPLSALVTDDFTPLFLLFLTLHACRSLQSHSSAFICCFHFLHLYSWAKDTVLLHRAGNRQQSLEPRFRAGSGEKTRIVQSSCSLGQPWDGTSQGVGSAGISYSTLGD